MRDCETKGIFAMKNIRKHMALFLAVAVVVIGFYGCGSSENQDISLQEKEEGKIYYDNEIDVKISDSEITVNGKAADKKHGVYVTDDVIYYEDKDSYESGNPYGEGTAADKHTEAEAADVSVVNITKAGVYRLSGELNNGQIRVDLGKDADEDETAVVTLVLDGLDINCDIAPAVLFLNVYECDNYWEEETADCNVDTSSAGANIIIADGSTNNIEGSYVAKIFKDKEGEK